MATIIINTENDQSEKVLKAFLNALEIDYQVKKETKSRPLNKKEQQIFESLKGSFVDIKKFENGELQFNDALTFMNEL